MLCRLGYGTGQSCGTYAGRAYAVGITSQRGTKQSYGIAQTVSFAFDKFGKNIRIYGE